MAIKPKKTKQQKLTPEQKKERKLKYDHRNMVRSVFRETGFTRIGSLSDKEFTYKNQKTDFDDVFVLENLIVCAEYTITSTGNISHHLKPKKIIYDKIQESNEEFVDFYCAISENLKSLVLGKYHPSEVVVIPLYCSRFDVEPSHKENVDSTKYLDYPHLRYFKSLVECIHLSARYELTDFLGVPQHRIGSNGSVPTTIQRTSYHGSLLPEASSNFSKGFKVTSFYASPSDLLKCIYVSRNSGWRASYNMYQRMVSKKKIDSTRKHLKNNKRVFVNNIIATLPSDTMIVGATGKTIDHTKINVTQPAIIQLPIRMNSIGIIDGQHRTYAYHETRDDDDEIAKLRNKQNLLVTGIIYPDDLTSQEKERFEAKLFLEINSTQTSARPALKQAIGVILDPFAAGSIATRVLDALDRSTGPLSGQVERFFYDKDKLKTASVVAYALRPLVKTSGTDSLFHIWDEPNKLNMISQSNGELLEKYISFCVKNINMFLSASKSNVASAQWTTDPKIQGRMITTTVINSLLITLRYLIQDGKSGDFDLYRKKLYGFSQFPFKDFKSSQYAKMANKIVDDFFS